MMRTTSSETSSRYVCTTTSSNDDIFNRADCLPAFFTICDPLYKRHAAGIIENELCRFKVDIVLGLVDLVFRLIPFDPHLYLQYSKYESVKASSGPRPCQGRQCSSRACARWHPSSQARNTRPPVSSAHRACLVRLSRHRGIEAGKCRLPSRSLRDSIQGVH